MYLHLGQSVVVPHEGVLGVFDLDNTTASPRTRAFLERAEREGRLISVFDDLPRAFVVCGDTVYLTQLSAAALRGRAEGNSFE